MNRLLQNLRPWLTALERLPWLRSLALACVCLFGVIIYLHTVTSIYPLQDWFLLQIATIVGWCALLHISCIAAGHALLSQLGFDEKLHFTERLLLNMALGLVVFVLLMYVGGALCWYSSTWALLLPALMLLSAIPSGLRAYRRGFRPRVPRLPSLPALYWLALAGAAIALFLLYLQVLPPSALNYDSRWYHLTVGEDYAREGGIVPFPADYNKASFPQLTGFIYAWGCLVPGLNTPLRVMFILHNEFFMVLWILVGVSAGARWLLQDRSVPGLWTVFFLFPGIYVYDSNLGGSADHVLGFFAIPVFLAAVRVSDRFELSWALVLGIVTGGAILTKYQAVYMIVGVTPVIAGRWLYGVVRRRSELGRALWLAPVLIIGATVAASSPHFIKNWVFYGNPIYPYFTDVITTSHPVQPETAASVNNMWMERSLRPDGDALTRIKEALSLVTTFSFTPHYSVNRPVFGSLFTLLLPALLFVRPRKRLFLGATVGLCALGFWASSYLVDRYIQTFSAVLIMVTAGLLVTIWKTGRWARLGVACLVLTQLAWGADALVYEGHSRINESLTLMRSGFEGKAKTRLDRYMRDTRLIDERLPKDAVLLFHNTRLALGVNRRVYQDLAGYQSMISYRKIQNARQLIEMYRSFGITHIVHERGRWKALTRQEDVVFSVFAQHYAGPRFRAGIYEVIELPEELPPKEPDYQVLCLGLFGYPNGLYQTGQLSTLEPLPPELKSYSLPRVPVGLDQARDHLDKADVVLSFPTLTLPGPLKSALNHRYKQVFSFPGQVTVYVRRKKEELLK